MSELSASFTFDITEKTKKDINEALKELQGIVNSNPLQVQMDSSDVKKSIEDLKKDVEKIKKLQKDLSTPPKIKTPSVNVKNNKKGGGLFAALMEDDASEKQAKKELTQKYKAYSSILVDVQQKWNQLSSRQAKLKSQGGFDLNLDKSIRKLKVFEETLQKAVTHYDTALKDLNKEKTNGMTPQIRRENSQAALELKKVYGGLESSLEESVQRMRNGISNLMNEVTRSSKMPADLYDSIVKDQSKYNKSLETSSNNLNKLKKIKQNIIASGGEKSSQLIAVDESIKNTEHLESNLRKICETYRELNNLARKDVLTSEDEASIKRHQSDITNYKNKYGENLSTTDHVRRIDQSLQSNMTLAQATKSAYDLERNAAKMSQQNVRQTIGEFKSFSSLLNTIQNKKNSLMSKDGFLSSEGFQNTRVTTAVKELNVLESQVKDVISSYDILLRKMNGSSTANTVKENSALSATQNILFSKTGDIKATTPENIQRTKNYVNELNVGAVRSYNSLKTVATNQKEYNALLDKSLEVKTKLETLKKNISSLKDIGYTNEEINGFFPSIDQDIKRIEELNQGIIKTRNNYNSLVQKGDITLLNSQGLTTAAKKEYETKLKNESFLLDNYDRTLAPKTKINTESDYVNYRQVLASVNNELVRMAELKAKVPQSNSLYKSLERDIQEMQLLRTEYEQFMAVQKTKDNVLLGKKLSDKEKDVLGDSGKRDPIAYNTSFNANMKKVSTSFDSSYLSAKKLNTELTKINNLAMKAASYASKFEVNLKKAGQFSNFQTFIKRANNGEFANFSDALDQLRKLQSAARAAGVETETFGSMLSKTFGSRVRSAMAGMGTFFITDSFKALFQNVKNIDTAMTELKKVTNETRVTYDKFLDDAQTRSKNIGVTLTDTVSATADYARLGYSLDEAKSLADSALIYFNVGDGIQSIDEATSSLISTMQGFQLQASDSMGIVDKFNEV